MKFWCGACLILLNRILVLIGLFDIDRLHSFSRVDVCVGAKSPMFLESYGGDSCDCDDEMMMALMLFVAMAVGVKIDLR